MFGQWGSNFQGRWGQRLGGCGIDFSVLAFVGGPQDAKRQIFLKNFAFTDFGRKLEKKILECPKKR